MWNFVNLMFFATHIASNVMIGPTMASIVSKHFTRIYNFEIILILRCIVGWVPLLRKFLKLLGVSGNVSNGKFGIVSTLFWILHTELRSQCRPSRLHCKAKRQYITSYFSSEMLLPFGFVMTYGGLHMVSTLTWSARQIFILITLCLDASRKVSESAEICNHENEWSSWQNLLLTAKYEQGHV